MTYASIPMSDTIILITRDGMGWDRETPNCSKNLSIPT
jgi:hypothetical protein